MAWWIVHVSNLAATEALGRRLGDRLFPGAVLALVGQLGAGKTHLTRAIAEGLQVRNPAAVNSPTFVLIQEYTAKLPIYHFDAYRLSGEREFWELGADEYFHGDGVCIVEWADRVPGAMPSARLDIHIDVVSEHERRLTLTAHGTAYDALLRQLQK
jgi:tRNA threonylcarbamoyladenosine biosynthesis protein TsaE